MTTIRQNIYAAYLDGDAMPMEALRSLCSDYQELDDSYKQFGGIRDQVRDQISHIVAKDFDGKVEVAGFGTLRITTPTLTRGYDVDALERVIDSIADDYPAIANALALCRKETMRVGGLRIERRRR